VFTRSRRRGLRPAFAALLLCTLTAQQAARVAAAPSAASGATVVSEFKVTAAEGMIGEYFGDAIALDGDTMVVGARHHWSAEYASGAAYVFVRDGESWVEQQRLTAPDAGLLTMFGVSVAVEGDTVVVGAAGADGFAGAAYVFAREGVNWTLQQKLSGSVEGGQSAFGSGVAVGAGTIVVGAHSDSSAAYYAGAVYVFTREGSGWVRTQKLLAGDAAYDQGFGGSVAFDGKTIVVGASRHSGEAFFSGAAYVFKLSKAGWVEEQRLTPADPAERMEFGYRVALDGDTAVVAAPYAVGHNGPAYGDAMGQGQTYGAAYVFECKENRWLQQKRLVARDSTAFGGYAYSVAVEGDTIVVGHGGDHQADRYAGAAYVYRRNGAAGWSEQLKLTAGDTVRDDGFGSAVALDGESLAVGAFLKTGAAVQSGAAYVIRLSF
jgi:hypothetical protein